MKFKLTFSLILFSFLSHSQISLNSELYNHANSCSGHYEKNMEKLTDYLISEAENDKEKVEVIAYWITQNIDYKYVNRSFKFDEEDKYAYETLKTKKAVCHGYASLFKMMCEKAGIEAYMINGYSKGLAYKKGMKFKNSDHTWNAVYIDSEFYLFDVTWATGYMLQQRFKSSYIKELDTNYLFTKPETFIEDHLPVQAKWQLLKRPVSMNSYTNNEKYENMKSNYKTDFNYNDSLQVYRNLNYANRLLKDAKEAERFYYSEKDIADLYQKGAFTIINNNPSDKKELLKAKEAYIKAIKIYKSCNCKNNRIHINNSQKSLKYVEYLLEQD